MTEQGDVALKTLIGQIDVHVEQIRKLEDGGCVCPGHRPLAEGIVLLLEIKRVEYRNDAARQQEMVSTKIAAIAALVIALLQSIGTALWRSIHGSVLP